MEHHIFHWQSSRLYPHTLVGTPNAESHLEKTMLLHDILIDMYTYIYMLIVDLSVDDMCIDINIDYNHIYNHYVIIYNYNYMSGCSVLLSVSVAKFKQRSCLRAERSQTYCCKRAKAMP